MARHTSTRTRTVLLSVGLGLAVTVAPAVAVVVDDFTSGGPPLVNDATGNYPGGTALGGHLNATLVRLEGLEPMSLTAGASLLELDIAAAMRAEREGLLPPATRGLLPPATRGRAELTWDGDPDPLVFDPTGLGGLDLTVDGEAFRLVVDEADAGIEVVLTVHTDGGNASFAARSLPDVAAPTSFVFPFSTFAPSLGAGADFSDVGAVRLRLQGTSARHVVLDLLETFGPSVDVTMSDLSVPGDTDLGATPVSPGDPLKYRITVTNTGGDARNLAVTIENPDIDSNVTVNTVQTAPLALDDTYRAVGNVARVVAALAGTLANDQDPDGDLPQVDIGASDVASARGGTIAWNDVGGGLGDGAFTYTPPPGARGVDTFSYTAVDDDGRTDTGTVTMLLDTVVWFVDDTHGGADLGTLADPFQSITALNLNGPGGGGDEDLPEDVIFFFSGSGSYSGGLELENRQTVLGPEDGLVVDGLLVVPDADDARPTLTAAGGHGLTLAENNVVRALDIGATPTGVGLVGSGFGTLTLADVAVAGPGGAVALANGTVAATFDAIASTSGALGVDLDGVDGSFTVAGATTLDGIAGTALRVVDGGASFDFGATAIGQSVAPTAGVSLTSSTAATFTFGSLAVTSGGGGAFVADTAGTVTVGGAANTLAATGGSALDVASTAFGAVFAAVSADGNGGAAPGIRLVGVSDPDAAPAVTITAVTLDDTTGSGIAVATSSGEIEILGGTVGATTDTGDAAHPAVDVAGGSAQVTVAAAITNTVGRSVEVTGRSGGTVSLRGFVDDDGTGIRLDSNGAGTVELRGGMALDTGGDVAFSATGSGTVAVCATDDCAAGTPVVNTIGAGTALRTTAVEIAGVTIGASGVTFRSLSVDQGAVSPDEPAVVLTNTGAGPFTVTGVGATAGSGGTVANLTNTDGVRLSNTGGLVTLRNMILEDIGDSDDGSDGIGTRSGVDGIHGQMVLGGLRLDGVTMRRFSDNAVLGALFADGTTPTTWNGLEILNSTLQDSNRYHVGPEGPGGLGDDLTEGMVQILGIAGTVTIDDTTFERGGQLIDFLTASSGTLAMTVQRSQFLRTIKEFRCMQPGTVNVGKAGLSVRVDGSADVDLFVGDPAESDPGLGNTFVDNATASIVVLHDDNAATGEIDTVISRNTFRVVDHLTGPAGCPGGSFQFNTAQGGVFLGPGSGGFEGIVSHNLFDQVQAANGGIGQLSVTFDDGGDGELIVRGNSFTLPWDASVRLLADGNNSAAVLFGGPGAGEANTYVDGLVGGPGDDVGGPTQSPFNPWSVNVRNGGSLDLKIDSEVLPQHDDMFSAFNHSFDASINPTGGTLNLHITDSASPDGYRFDISGGTLNLFNEENVAGCPLSAAQILDDNGNTGGMNSDATDPPVVVGGGVTCSTTPPTAPSVVIP